MLISIEGIEGSGKTTNASFIVKMLNDLGFATIHTREPGGTIIAEKIRKIFLNQDLQEPITSKAELLLLFAARSQHLENLIIPSLNKGQYIVCERFTDASFAYQGGGRKIDFKYIKFLEEFVQGSIRPDHIFLLDVDVDVALKRIQSRKNLDRIEKEHIDFFNRVRQIYLERAALDPKKYHIINANLHVNEVTQQITDLLVSILP